MQTFKTVDYGEMRRAKQSQYIGRAIDLQVEGKTVHGAVVSVFAGSDRQSWMIKFLPRAASPTFLRSPAKSISLIKPQPDGSFFKVQFS